MLTLSKTDNPKRLAVIGGGPAGLEADHISALRLYSVTIFEKGELGGNTTDTIVNAIGYVPNESLRNELSEKTTIEIHWIFTRKTNLIHFVKE